MYVWESERAPSPIALEHLLYSCILLSGTATQNELASNRLPEEIYA